MLSMPQLVKGGKHTFGWSRVGDTGRIIIPPEAREEYGLKESETLLLVPGSQTSGGFGLGSQESLARSPRGVVADLLPGLGASRVPAGEVVEYKGKPYCWVELRKGGVSVPPSTLQRYGVRLGDRLLVIRGSGLAIGFAVRGPIVEEAKNHRELEVFEPEIQEAETA
jgi:bifunctional DNA-binding transcriptional regulator/antitoxin component of YhaV-PrlF toxin-antitoxin module